MLGTVESIRSEAAGRRLRPEQDRQPPSGPRCRPWGQGPGTRPPSGRQVVKTVRRKYSGGGIPSVEHVQDIVEKVLIEGGTPRPPRPTSCTASSTRTSRGVPPAARHLHRGRLPGEAGLEGQGELQHDLLPAGPERPHHPEGHLQLLVELHLPARGAEAHLTGEFHIHDLGTLGPYCVAGTCRTCSWSAPGVRGKVESRPPKHFDVALMQVVTSLHPAGRGGRGPGLLQLRHPLESLHRRDGLGYDEVKQAVQKFLFNMNVPTRVGFQTPFTNITLDLKVPEFSRGPPRSSTGGGGAHLRGVPAEVDLSTAPSPSACRGGRERAAVHLPDPDLQRHPGLPWDSRSWSRSGR